MTDKVIPLRPAKPPTPVFTVHVLLTVDSDGVPSLAFPDGMPLTAADFGDLMLRATYRWNRMYLEGFAVIALGSGDTNLYIERSLRWDHRMAGKLRRRLDDVYHGITGRHRNLFHWLRTRSPK